jgi:adenylate cyclase
MRGPIHPQPQLPNIKEVNSGIVAGVLRISHGRDRYDGSIREDQGREYLFRVAKFTLGEQTDASIFLLAAQEDFAQDVRRLRTNTCHCCGRRLYSGVGSVAGSG